MRLRTLTLNIHKGVASLRPGLVLERLRTNIRAVGADLVLLQEVIGESGRLRSRYAGYPTGTQLEYLADSVWPHRAYARNAVSADSDHGNAILSAWPIDGWSNVDVSVPGREPRGMLVCRPRLPDGSELTVGCVHLGLGRVERRRQLERIAQWVEAEAPRGALLLAGDFNDWRGDEVDGFAARLGLREAFRELHGRGARSFPAMFPLLPLDRVYARGPRFAAARRTGAGWRLLSDHLALVVDVELRGAGERRDATSEADRLAPNG